MKTKTVRIATRQSPLALWQANHVREKLLQAHAALTVELIPIVTKGDIILDTPLAKIGGKGLFVKELEKAILEQRADIAVHSMKDVPIAFPAGLGLAVICQREDPRDALLSLNYSTLQELPAGAIVGTSSLRRQCQLRQLRPDLQLHDLRGNVGTRLRKLKEGEFDAIILAAAGLKRLESSDQIQDYFAPEQLLPAAGQGAIGIECRLEDKAITEILAPLNDRAAWLRVSAERALNIHLQGGCQVPIGSYAELQQEGEQAEKIWLRALVGKPDGSQIIRGERYSSSDCAEQAGIDLAEELLGRGARDILRQIIQHG